MSESQNRKFSPYRTIGFVGVVAMIAPAMLAGGTGVRIFFNIPSIAIITGITFFLLLANFGKNFLKFIPDCFLTFVSTAEKPNPKFAEIALAGSRYVIAAGVIGTLIGLIQMLANLENPGSIGLGMATALLTIFYAVIVSEFLFTFLQKAYTDGQIKQSAQPSLRNTAFAAAVVAIVLILFCVLLISFSGLG
jgi:flagellar motor component MotA